MRLSCSSHCSRRTSGLIAGADLRSKPADGVQRATKFVGGACERRLIVATAHRARREQQTDLPSARHPGTSVRGAPGTSASARKEQASAVLRSRGRSTHRGVLRSRERAVFSDSRSRWRVGAAAAGRVDPYPWQLLRSSHGAYGAAVDKQPTTQATDLSTRGNAPAVTLGHQSNTEGRVALALPLPLCEVVAVHQMGGCNGAC
jgi:hypothetical protein